MKNTKMRRLILKQISHAGKTLKVPHVHDNFDKSDGTVKTLKQNLFIQYSWDGTAVMVYFMDRFNVDSRFHDYKTFYTIIEVSELSFK